MDFFEEFSICPVRTGMNPVWVLELKCTEDLPRAYGDEPYVRYVNGR